MNESTKTLLSTALAGLTQIQRTAVEWNDGPLLVLAGPGSGKTQVLTCRMARLLTDTQDKNFRILGLTFTNKAAGEMRDRVETFVAGQSRRLFLGTFHSFCAEVLRQHGTHLRIKPDFRILGSDREVQSVMRSAIAEAKKTNSNVTDNDVKLLPVVNRLMADLVSPEQSPSHVLDPSLKERIQSVYSAYETCLKAENSLDFNSLVFQAHTLFTRFPAFARRYQTVYPYWCVDEFQDTNAAQYALLRAMASGGFRNLFLVADDDQIIYQWNGASHKRIEEFRTEFKPDVVQLPTNYRCPPEIVSLANNLIRHNSLRSAGKLPLIAAKKSTNSSNEVLRLSHFSSYEEEASGIAHDIRELHFAHPSAVAVLARNRKLLDSLKVGLHELGIESVIAQRRDDFASQPFIWMHACLRQAIKRNDAHNVEVLAGAFTVLSGIEVEVPALIAQADAKHSDYLKEWAETIQKVSSDAGSKKVAEEVLTRLVLASDYGKFIAFALSWFQELASTEHEATAERFVGFEDDKRAWTELSSEIAHTIGDTPTLEAFLHELDLRSKEPPATVSHVALMTIHAAKGKEFDHVYLMGLAEDLIPSFQSKKKGEYSPEMEEERRNCFVAITRTKQTLTLSFADEYSGWPKRPSRFLEEMGLEM
jgi:DNA helicase-2/ATP-dependent DNA helicase PcrA